MKLVLANKNNYGAKRSLSKIKYIVIHYTANDGDTDEANAKYFKNNVVKASAHYFVDSDSITQSVPDDYVAWAVGGKRYSNYKNTGGAVYYGKCTNTNSISIELCDDKKDGRLYPSDDTINRAVELTKSLMAKYNIPASNVIRHFDVTGKSCPAYWVNGSVWQSDFKNKLTGKVSEPVVIKTVANSSFKVKVTVDALNYRAGAGITYKVKGTVKKDQVYTIVETKGNWGKLKSGAGWINISGKYVTRV